MKGWSVAIVAGVLLVGCSTTGDDKLSMRPDDGGSKSSGAGAAGSAEKPVSAKDAPDINKPFANVQEPNKEFMATKETREGFKPPSEGSEVRKESLGELIDTAIEKLPPSLVAVEVHATDRGAILQSRPTAKIQDRKTFSIEYSVPENKGKVGMLVGDGKERGHLDKGKLVMLKPFDESEVRATMNRAEIIEFAMAMPKHAFRYYSHGDRVWSALVAGLQDPANGFEVKFDETKAKPVGEERPFYRLYAESTKGEEPITIEFMVDSKRNVPVNFRVNRTFANKETYQLTWRASWNFGGQHNAKDFRIPLKK
jgi:hypothetical protein